MALVNHAKKEINAKIVYFGPADSGKSLALRYIFSRIKPSLRGDLKKVPTGGDNLLFFDFSPFEGPLHDGYRVRLHVYTLTGRVTNPAAWKMTLKGADGLVIMVDSSPDRISEVQESISQLRGFLSAYGTGLHETSAVLQLNRFEREPAVMNTELLVSSMNLPHPLPRCTSCAASGEGVLEALTTLSRLVLDRVSEKYNTRDEDVEESVDDASEGLLELPKDTSGYEPPNLTGVVVKKPWTETLPPISLACHGVSVEGTMLNIPLEISCGPTNHRLIVTVSVNPE